MSSLKDFLPAPTDGLTLQEDEAVENSDAPTVVAAPASPTAGVSNVVALRTTEEGPDYSAIVKQGENATRIVHARYDAMVEKPRHEVLQPLPTEEEAVKAARETKAALEGIVSNKLNAGASSKTKRKEKPKFIRYTPANASAASQQRIIKMVQAPRDPMEPPRFAQRKAPVNPPSPPVPVMHSPDRKLSKEEAEDWKIPPVVSDWKNNRGYTISLDKRLAADGRALADHSINDRFANMAEALYQAEKTARAEVEKRATLQRQVSVKAKAARERELRQLADKARKERREFLGLSERTDTESIAGTRDEAFDHHREDSRHGVEVQVEDDAPPSFGNVQNDLPERSERQVHGRADVQRRRRSRFSDRKDFESGGKTNTQPEMPLTEKERHRDEIRRERRLEREREMRLREVHGNEGGRPTLKRSKLTRDVDRDISEQAALGQSVHKAPRGEVMYDERLFNQDGGRGRTSLTGGYGADDMYNLYEEPLFKGSSMSSRNLHVRGNNSARQEESQIERNGPQAEQSERGRGREGPVEFERDDASTRGKKANDPYGLNTFLKAAEDCNN